MKACARVNLHFNGGKSSPEKWVVVEQRIAIGRSYLPNQSQLGFAALRLRGKDGAVVCVHPDKRNLTGCQHRLKSRSLLWPNPKLVHCVACGLDHRKILGVRNLMPASDLLRSGGRVIVEIPSHSASHVVEQRILAREGAA